ncbi:PQQ-binding-like beta-propeller repeat protein [Kitasatospora aureofaciens]|uniref:outer membrane protein assembly factor BamB family protein n=1 Tax=Kitasatospora aureofaciens TaxID=1894 RepID=UPI003812D39D
MAGDHPTPGTGETPGSGPQDNRGVSFGRQPGTDPAAVADQMTQLDGSAIPGPAAPAGPPAQPAAPPGGGAAYAPTAAAFPSQAPPPPPAGAPVGPYDPMPGASYAAPDAGQTFGGGYGYPQEQQQAGYTYPTTPVPAVPKQRNPVMMWGGIIGGVLAVAIVAGLIVLFTQKDNPDNPTASSGGTTSTGGTSGDVTDAPTIAGSSSGGNTGGGGGGGASYNVAWNAPKATTGDGSAQILGIWGTDKVTVRADSTGIRGFNVTDGKEAWNIPVPSGAKELCAASYSTNSKNVAAVAFNTGDSDCSTIGAVDISQGKLLWSAKVSNDRVSYPTLSVTDKVVAIGGNLVGAVNIDNGSPVWQFQPRDKDCSLYGRAGGNQIAVSDRCYLTSGPKSQLVIVDADTGKTTSSPITLQGSIERVDKVVSDQPLVLLMSSGPNGDYVLPFDKSNKPGNPMSVKEPGSDSLRLSGESDAMTQNVVSGNILYAQITGSNSAVNAYDLTTGKRIWSAAADSNQDIRLVSGYDKDGKVRVIVSQGYRKPARLVTLSPTDGKMTDLGTLAMPDGLDIGMSLSEYVMAPDGNSVYAFSRGSTNAPVTKWKK